MMNSIRHSILLKIMVLIVGLFMISNLTPQLISLAQLAGETNLENENMIYLPVITKPFPFSTSRISVASDGTQGNAGSGGGPISADGRYVVFLSDANNLVHNDTNGFVDVFVHDRQTGQTSRVSVASAGTEGNGKSQEAVISDNGRYVAFASIASNLVIGDTNGTYDIFVHDRETGQTSRVSVASNGIQGNGHSLAPSISADGRYVAFSSDANNLLPGDNNGRTDIFVHDRQTGETSRVSVTSNGAQGNGSSSYPALSADSRYVAYSSWASNLVVGDTNNNTDVFVHDRQTGQTSRVSVATDNTQGNAESVIPDISADGRFVSFHSEASNLVVGDTNDTWDAFVHDRQTGYTSRVSLASDGTQSNGGSWITSISADGRYVAYMSDASNMVADDTNGIRDVFVHDRHTAQTSRISIASDGTQGNNSSFWPFISANGRYIGFESGATNLVANDTNGAVDGFVHDRGE